MITILGASKNSVYHSIPGIDVYDENRDLRNYTGTNPVITHAPCRKWSAYMSHYSNAPESEKQLAIICAKHVRKNGGIFEHPAHSRVFGNYLPAPGEDEKELYTLAIYQGWFGFPMRKNTWLTFSKIDRSHIDIPFKLLPVGKEKETFDNMSKKMRSYTTIQFANWLINLAGKVNGYNTGKRHSSYLRCSNHRNANNHHYPKPEKVNANIY